ncbi:MAG: hypothetical protein ED559_02975 [Phycisphaera sp.]|nr:MAG: hypothetical protein ED559_02975 [Phycisphaera sp.]
MITIPFPRWLRVLAFIVFALMVFIATHWPQLRIEGPIPRPDLFIHFAVFGLWALMLNISGLLGEPGNLRTSVLCFGVGLVYAAFDELTQMIPGLGRFAGIDDYLANAGGLAIGCSLSLLVRTKPEPKPLRR